MAVGPVPAFLNNDHATDNRYDVLVSLAGNDAGDWIAVWQTSQFGTGSNDVYTSRSADDAGSWSSPVALGPGGEPQIPTIATDRAGTWITATGTRSILAPGDDSDYDVAYRRSFDNGATWTTLSPLNSSAANTSSDGVGRVALGFGNAIWIASWSGLHNLNYGDADIYFSRSTDSGATWSPQEFLAPSEAEHDPSGQGDAEPTLATDGAGNWLAAWHAVVAGGPTVGTLDVLMSVRSNDDGLTWSEPIRMDSIFSNAFGYNPKIAYDGNGHWVMAWQRNSQVLTTASGDLGQTWSTPYNHGSISYLDAPTLAFGGGTWFLAWETGPGKPNAIAYSPDGEVWSPPIVVSAPDTGGRGSVVADSTGRAIVAYESGGTFYFDSDLYYVICSEPLIDPDCDSTTNNADDCPLTSDYSQANQDGDPFGDECDSCPTLPESAQADREGDGVGDACDNCPSWPNPYQSLPNWPIASGDDDCDGFPDTVDANGKARETYIGTDPLRHCAATTGANNEPLPDAMPQDFNDDQLINGQDTGKFGGPFGSFNKLVSAGPFGPSGNQLPGERFDFNGNGIINGQDTGKYQAYYNKVCVPSGP